MDSQKELLNWKRLIITTLLVVVASALTSSITWFILDRTFNESQQTNAALVETLEKKITYLDTRIGGSTATTDFVTTKVEPLTQQKILNATYTVDGKTYVAINGTVTTGGNTLLIKADKSVVNDDSAFVVLNVNMGGTGFFYKLVYMVNVSGKAVQSDIVDLGDRSVVNSVTFASGKVTIDMVVAGPNDPSCCPTLKSTKIYNVTAGKLVLAE